MSIKNIERLYSCKRKRDYVKGLAIVLFAFLIIFQIALVVSLQGYLQKMEILETNKQRLQLLEELDLCRMSLPVLDENTERSELNREEERLLTSVFDRIAVFLRDSETLYNLTLPQINEMRDIVRRLRVVGERWSWWYWGTKKLKPRPFVPDYAIRDEQLDVQSCVRILESRIASQSVPPQDKEQSKK